MERPAIPEHEMTPDGPSPWAVSEACREIIETSGVDPNNQDVAEMFDTIIGAQDTEIAITTALSHFEGLDLPTDGLLFLLFEKGIIDDFQ
jgi:hypothetical protein